MGTPAEDAIAIVRSLCVSAGDIDQSQTSVFINRCKQLGVISPAGGKRWKLGESILAYAAQRSVNG